MTAGNGQRRPRVLVISASPIGPSMAGPAIRPFEFARTLEPVADVTLAAAAAEDETDEQAKHVVFRQQDPRALKPHVLAADVVVGQPPWPLVAAWCRRSGARLIYDLYDPEPLEMLAHRAAGGGTGAAHFDGLLTGIWETLTLDRVLQAMHEGHHFLCASEKQRDLWIGTMLGERLLRPRVYRRDPSLREVIDTAPFGVPGQAPRHSGSDGIRGRFPQIATSDEVVLWNGGIWNWLDATTAVRAMARLSGRRETARLVFMGFTDNINGRRATAEARGVAEELGLLDRAVFFNDTWVPYQQRGDWLLEADCAVSCHVEQLETRFAFRTRLLDCFWAGLPIVCTRGDDLAARVERDDLGATVPAKDPEALGAALERVLDRGRSSYAAGLAVAAADHAWSRVAEPVIRYATAKEPVPRLGPHPIVRPERFARTQGFRLARSTLNAVGLDHWPKL